MLAEAKRECDRIIREAREQAMREASQTEIVKLAEKQAEDIVEDAKPQGARDAARDGGLGGLDPVDARGEPRQVPRRRQARSRTAARALAGDGRRRHRARAADEPPRTAEFDRFGLAARQRPNRPRARGTRRSRSRRTPPPPRCDAGPSARRARSRERERVRGGRRPQYSNRPRRPSAWGRRPRPPLRRRAPAPCRCCRSGTRCSEPGRASELRLDVVHGATAVEADDRLEHDLFQRGRPLRRRKRRAGRQDEHVGVVEQLDGLVRAARHRSVQKVRSRSPRSISSSSSLSSCDSRRTTSTCGWLSRNVGAGAG